MHRGPLASPRHFLRKKRIFPLAKITQTVYNK